MIYNNPQFSTLRSAFNQLKYQNRVLDKKIPLVSQCWPKNTPKKIHASFLASSESAVL